ncbi:MAG: hypothetical protein AAGA77_13640 [Bacteroidota bacterium]
MKYIYCLGLFLFISTTSYGQYSTRYLYKPYDYDTLQGFRVGIVPSALINRWLGYQGKVSYRFGRYEVELNAGYLKGTDNAEPYHGYRIRPVYKIYTVEDGNGAYYWGIGALLRQLNIDADGTFSRFNNSFFQTLDFELDQRMLGGYGLFGVLMPLYKDRFFLDFYVAGGFAQLKTQHFNIPDDAELLYDLPFFSVDSRGAGSLRYPIALVHISFSVQL